MSHEVQFTFSILYVNDMTDFNILKANGNTFRKCTKISFERQWKSFFKDNGNRNGVTVLLVVRGSGLKEQIQSKTDLSLSNSIY